MANKTKEYTEVAEEKLASVLALAHANPDRYCIELNYSEHLGVIVVLRDQQDNVSYHYWRNYTKRLIRMTQDDTTSTRTAGHLLNDRGIWEEQL